MDWKHLVSITIGAACLTISVVVPATAPALAPLAGVLLLMSDPRKALLPPGPPAAPRPLPPPAPKG
jgi:hypothetical protein